jgi:DNA-binding transcriptional ArsR family regulator
LLLTAACRSTILNHMVKYTEASAGGYLLDATFGALADPTRRAILARLALGEATVTELAKPFDVSLPAVSKHLRVLESAGLLRREIDGRIHRCSLAPAPMKDAAAWIATYRAFWEAQLDALANYLESEGLESARLASTATASKASTEKSAKPNGNAGKNPQRRENPQSRKSKRRN